MSQCAYVMCHAELQSYLLTYLPTYQGAKRLGVKRPGETDKGAKRL